MYLKSKNIITNIEDNYFNEVEKLFYKIVMGRSITVVYEINNIEDMIFCHNALFCCSAKTLEGAIKCAVVALNEEIKYDKKFDEGVKYIMSGIEKQFSR